MSPLLPRSCKVALPNATTLAVYPESFSIELSIDDGGYNKRLSVLVNQEDTPYSFRSIVLALYDIPLSQDVLVHMDRELTEEYSTLVNQGVVPKSTIHAGPLSARFGLV